MTPNLERRLAALESAANNAGGIRFITRQIVSPGNLEPENSFYKIDGIKYIREPNESSADFDNRMREIADALNRKDGRLIQIICSATDFDL